jgi:hypothetical protein
VTQQLNKGNLARFIIPLRTYCTWACIQHEILARPSTTNRVNKLKASVSQLARRPLTEHHCFTAKVCYINSILGLRGEFLTFTMHQDGCETSERWRHKLQPIGYRKFRHLGQPVMKCSSSKLLYWWLAACIDPETKDCRNLPVKMSLISQQGKSLQLYFDWFAP